METSLYETDDSRNYLSIDGLIAVSGVQKNYHLKLAVKEIVDNALDASGFCVLGMIGKCAFYVHDSGTGIPGTDEQIAYLFSVNRKTISTKSDRYPRRGAMGRGLRFVSGVVFCYNATLKVSTNGRTLLLKPEDGGTRFTRVGGYDGYGTRIEIEFPSPISHTELEWGELAKQLAQGDSYDSYSSPWWYDSQTFYVLLKSIVYQGGKVAKSLKDIFGGRYALRDMDLEIQKLLNQETADSFSSDDAGKILSELRKVLPKEIKPGKIGRVGELKGFNYYYIIDGKYDYDISIQEDHSEHLQIPYVVELWAKVADKKELASSVRGNITIFVNKSPVAIPPVNLYTFSSSNDAWIEGNIGLDLKIKDMKKYISYYLNIITPFLPRTGDAKMPMIPSVLNDPINNVFNKANKKINRDMAFAGRIRQNGVPLKGLTNEMRQKVEMVQESAQQWIDGFFQKEGLLQNDHKYLRVLDKDPFRAGINVTSAAMAVWFENVWNRLNPDGKTIHLRRLHYQIVSQIKEEREKHFKKHDKGLYENNYTCWQYLLYASKYARELRMIDPLLIVDRRNPLPYGKFITSFEFGQQIDFPDWFVPKINLDSLLVGKFPVPGLHIDEQMAREHVSALQPVHLEIWTEKATMNDILEDICRSYGIILVQNTGYSSITGIERFLKERALQIDKPSVILYISDFDEAGENMPVMVSRTLQHRIVELKKKGLWCAGKEISVHPIILTREQMESAEFETLPKAPAKTGVGTVTELDALEAIKPGRFREIVLENVQKVLDQKIIDNLPMKIESVKIKYQEVLRSRTSQLVMEAKELQQGLAVITDKYKQNLQHISNALQKEIEPYQEKLSSIRKAISEQAEEALQEVEIDMTTEKQPSLDDNLFLSSRSFRDQTKRLLKYRSFKKGYTKDEYTEDE